MERALNSRTGDIVVKVSTELGFPPPNPDPNPNPNPDPNPDPGPLPKILVPDVKAGDMEQKVAPSLAITIYQESDAALEGALCQAELRGYDILVAVTFLTLMTEDWSPTAL